MKTINSILLAAPLIVLAGCNSSSSADKDTKPVLDKPLANYTFTSAALIDLMKEREQIFESMSVYFDGTTYNQMKFAETTPEGNLVVQLQDNSSNTIDIQLSEGQDDLCMIYSESKLRDYFVCNDSVSSVSNESTLIQSKTKATDKDITVEFISEAPELIPSIGSTLLTVTSNNNAIEINTSFAFKAFYREMLSITDAASHADIDNRIHSTLGATTYLQVQDIVQQYKGSDMTFKFSSHIGGSADDDINLYTGLLIHDNNMTTVVTATGSVFSGGTDLFAAGKVRILERADDSVAIEANKQIGVHSWSNGQQSAKEIPYTDESHRKQATFFNTVMGDKGIDFYVFTLDSAPFDGEHWVTKADSDKYDFITTIQ
jgi:hypothetical protein